MQRRYSQEMKKVKKPKIHSKENVLSERELKELLNFAEDISDELFITLAGYEGMRIGEIAHMESSWVNFQDRYIDIPATKKCDCCDCKAYRDGVWSPKTQYGVRKIPIRVEAIDVIERYFRAYRRVGCSRQTIFNHIKAVAKKTTITKRVYPHSLRATAATSWGEMGVSAPTLCYIMGWNDIEIANNYVKSTEESALQEIRWRENQRR